MLRPQISRVLSQCSMSLHRSRIASSEYSIRRDRLATSVSKTVGNMVLPTNKTIEVLGKLASKETVLFLETSDWDGSDIASLRNSFASVHGIRTHIDQLRFIKSKAEIESMRDVCGMGAQFRRGADMLSYPPVVAAGDRANTIHYLDANQTIDNGDCVLVDAGCELDGYVSDITRSFPISGHWTDHQRTLYEALRYVHEQLLTYANDVEKLAEQLCPHHVSHYLGMDVHDCATISRDIDLPEGVVFTIEPGFRIEDDVATTSNGIEVLTDGVPRLADELEYLMDP
uniref:Peptidase_M24 domain-containing protein n=1 Tax=Heterorhabditis bacteriophora TaxID=37862 RepID=A0A1I7XP01_HETBA